MQLKTLCTSASVLALALTLASCSNKATEEQMKTLADLDRQRAGLQDDLKRAQQNLSEQQSKLANAKRDLTDCQNDTQGASAMLSRWPNVWADSVDWRLAPPPAPVTAPAKKMTMKKKH
jgi:chromosome segregation ATPase